MKIIILSYKRPERVKSLNLFAGSDYPVYISCRPDEIASYRKHNKGCRFLKTPHTNIAEHRNALLDRFPGQNILMLDDDINSIGYWEAGERHEVAGKELITFICRMFRLAGELNTVLWGLSVQHDKKFYRDYCPFSFSVPALGPVMGIINKDSSLRFDENIPLKEDYDFCLQVLNRYRKLLRNNKFHYVCDHITNAGGCTAQRTRKAEIRNMQGLIRKWGAGIVDSNRLTQDGNFTLNPIIRVPIKGI